MQSFFIILLGVVLAGLAAAHPGSATVHLNPSGSWAWATGTDTNCTKFVVPVRGDYCDKVAESAGISTKWFMQQNPHVDEKCSNLWTNTKYCVLPPKGQPGKGDPINVQEVDQEEAENQESDNTSTGLVTPGDAAGIVLHNKSPDTVCFAFEKGSGVSDGNLPATSACQIGFDRFPGLIIPPGQSRFHQLLPGFNGAVNVVVNGIREARHELTLVSGNPPGAFYDVDYEFGLSSSTFGPYDGRPRPDGLDSLMGEADILAKVNQHFKELGVSEQQALVSAGGKEYIQQGPHGDLVWIDNSKTGPPEIQYFLQCVAKVHGYVMPGSVPDQRPVPGTHQAEMVAAADRSTTEVLTQQLLLTVYPDRRQRP